MSDVRDSTCILSALLEPDGTILLQLSVPGRAEPIPATIEPTEATRRAAGPTTRAVQLAYGHPHDRLLRLLIAMHADALGQQHGREVAVGLAARVVHLARDRDAVL
jgi:hypothetical protein